VSFGKEISDDAWSINHKKNLLVDYKVIGIVWQGNSAMGENLGLAKDFLGFFDSVGKQSFFIVSLGVKFDDVAAGFPLEH
jgi:hypothetical protein